MDRLPNEVMNLIGIHIQEREWYSGNWNKSMTPWYAGNRSWKHDVASLRLVSSHFNAVFSHLLFQNLECHFNLGLERYPKRLTDLISLSRSKLCSHLESLVIRLEPTYRNSNAWADKAINHFFEDLCHCLPLCMQAFHKIRHLDMICSQATPGWYAEEFIPVKYCDQINTAIAVVLTQVNLERLEHLSLNLPVAADFAAIVDHDVDPALSQSQQPSYKVLPHLTSLTLRICDESGERGHRHYQKPQSLAKSGFAQQKQHEEAFFRIAGLATALDTLDIHCTVPLNLDFLATAERKSFNSLRILALYRVEVRGENLVRLLSESSATLKLVDFHEVELTAHTWEDVCLLLCSFPLLEDVTMLSCGYTQDGTSSRFCAELPGLEEEIQNLDSVRFRDIRALYDLTGLVNRRRQRCGLDLLGFSWISRESEDRLGGKRMRSSFTSVPDPDLFERLD